MSRETRSGLARLKLLPWVQPSVGSALFLGACVLEWGRQLSCFVTLNQMPQSELLHSLAE